MVQVLMALVGLAGLVCMIMVLIPMFKEHIGLGLAGILTCGLFAFIWGWVRVNQYGIKNLMIAWSILIAISLVLNIMFGASIASQLQNQ